MIFVSVGYRHAPEHRFPAAAEDGYAATCWIAEHSADLGGKPGPVMVAGWSAGGNIAAVTCQLARNRGGTRITVRDLLPVIAVVSAVPTKVISLGWLHTV
jgi:acetyl esterase/lipase